MKCVKYCINLIIVSQLYTFPVQCLFKSQIHLYHWCHKVCPKLPLNYRYHYRTVCLFNHHIITWSHIHGTHV